MIDRVEQRKEPTGALTIAEHRVSDDGPYRGVRVLPAVFTHTRNVSFYITGIETALVEWRCEENHEPITPPNQILFNRRHRTSHTIRIGPAGNHRPGLRDRIDATFFVSRRTERRAVIKTRAPVPVPLPGFFFEGLAHTLHTH